ncbi:MAG: TrmH family RNA methyltransferase [Candidatus Liptonbacteria bacterium]
MQKEGFEAVAILNNIRSIQNVASMFRTADGAGINKIYLTGITSSPLDRFGKPLQPFAKVSLGAEKSVPWEKVQRAGALTKKLKKDGYHIVAVEQHEKAVRFDKFDPRKHKKIAILMGEEVRGIPAPLIKLCDAVLEIPMRGKKESLNVSVAFGVASYAITRTLE